MLGLLGKTRTMYSMQLRERELIGCELRFKALMMCYDGVLCNQLCHDKCHVSALPALLLLFHRTCTQTHLWTSMCSTNPKQVKLLRCVCSRGMFITYGHQTAHAVGFKQFAGGANSRINTQRT